jgi:uncharacterized RDD family membrane protein YckC
MTEHVNHKMASRWKRLSGSLIDSIAAMTILLPVIFFTGLFKQIEQGLQMSTSQYLFFFILGWVVFMALNGYLLSNSGQTIGKYVVNTRIVDQDGNIPPFGKLLVYRYLFMGVVAQIPIIGAIAQLANISFIFSPQKRCLHDHIAGTFVVDISPDS